MTRYRKLAGLSLMEALVALSIVATLGALAAPSIEKAKRDTYVLKCKAQLQEMGVALLKYREEHSGAMPISLDTLVPKYISEEKFVCPLTMHMAPDAVRSWQGEFASGRTPWRWKTYMYFSRSSIDAMAKESAILRGVSFTDVLQKRGSDTPVAMCRDHREPLSLDLYCWARHSSIRPEKLPPLKYPYSGWHFPEDDIVILRWDGRVDTTKKGGSFTSGTFGSTLVDMLEL